MSTVTNLFSKGTNTHLNQAQEKNDSIFNFQTDAQKQDLDAEYYNKNSQVQKQLANDLLEYYKRYSIQVDENILDVGCGDGGITQQLANMAKKGKVVGVDSSTDMISFANENHISTNLNLSFKQIRAEDMDFYNEFSLITAFNSLYWVNDIKKVFFNIHSALKVKGKVLALIYPSESPYWQPFIEIFKDPEFNQWYPNSVCYNWLSEEDYFELAQNVGLKVIFANSSIEHINYLNKKVFKEYVSGWLSLIFTGPESSKADYLDKVTDLVWHKYSNVDESAKIPYKKLHLCLEK